MGSLTATRLMRFGDALLRKGVTLCLPPGERGDVRNADTLSVNFYLCTINRKLRETLRIVKKKDRDGELLC